jgi:tetratricopeptide (TPR) repeat protein
MNNNPIRNRFGDTPWGTLSALSLLAETYEQSGDLLEAAAVYERLIDENPTKRMVLAQRLVRIYAKEGQAEKALSWAHVVMEQNPEPQAYLAGVHTLLGHLDEAKDILEKLVAERKEPRQKLTLSWQLAEVYEKQDNIPAAEKTLLESVESVEGTIHETAAWSHICRFYDRHGLLETQTKEWEKTVREYPGNEKARRALAAASALTRR